MPSREQAEAAFWELAHCRAALDDAALERIQASGRTLDDLANVRSLVAQVGLHEDEYGLAARKRYCMHYRAGEDARRQHIADLQKDIRRTRSEMRMASEEARQRAAQAAESEKRCRDLRRDLALQGYQGHLFDAEKVLHDWSAEAPANVARTQGTTRKGLPDDGAL